jgi:hypothetical protein
VEAAVEAAATERHLRLDHLPHHFPNPDHSCRLPPLPVTTMGRDRKSVSQMSPFSLKWSHFESVGPGGRSGQAEPPNRARMVTLAL